MLSLALLRVLVGLGLGVLEGLVPEGLEARVLLYPLVLLLELGLAQVEPRQEYELVAAPTQVHVQEVSKLAPPLIELLPIIEVVVGVPRSLCEQAEEHELAVPSALLAVLSQWNLTAAEVLVFWQSVLFLRAEPESAQVLQVMLGQFLREPG